MSQGRCFRCLQRGHRRFQCMGKVKCLKCNGIGHMVGRCARQSQANAEGKQGAPASAAQQNLTNRGSNQERVNAQPPVNHTIKEGQIEPAKETRFVLLKREIKSKEQQTPPKMDPLLNWETMRMTDPSYIQGGQAQEMRVFLKPRKDLLPTNEFLQRSAIVMTGPNENDHTLRRTLQQKLAYHFTCHPRNFRIGKIPSSIGDLLAIFPNEDMKNRAVKQCLFKLGPGVEVQLADWTREIGMVHDPTTHKVMLLLHNLPMGF